jgi:two-component system chemotaxis response regulator CheY
MKILLVDDSNSIAMVVGQMLDEAGIEYKRASDGKEAYEFIKSGEVFDLILLDWNMPNMTGIEFLKKNKLELFTNSPVVMMTTENKPDKIKEALENGASEYIMKPFTQDILISKISSVDSAAA